MKNYQSETSPNNQFSSTLKKINLQQYQKPKTLIVVHYKGKRISVPLLGDCKNLTQMLYHHIDKFQQTVMKSQPNWQKISNKKIICFCSSSNSNELKQKLQINNNHLIKQDNCSNRLGQNLNQSSIKSINKRIQHYLKYADGDLKIDILLSLIRIQNSYQQCNFSVQLDITRYYKYMQIQPFYIIEKQRHNRTKQLKKQIGNSGVFKQQSSKITQNYNNYNDSQLSLKNNNKYDIKTDQKLIKSYQKGINIQNRSNSKKGKYFFYRLLQSNNIKNVYLARSIQDGYFYEVKVYRTDFQPAQRQANFIEYAKQKFQILKQAHFQSESQIKGSFYSKYDPIASALKDSQIHLIPTESLSQYRLQDSSEQQDQEYNLSQLKQIKKQEKGRQAWNLSSQQEDEDEVHFKDNKGLLQKKKRNQAKTIKNNLYQMKKAKHLVVITKYNPKGKLQQKILSKKTALSPSSSSNTIMNELLNYLKQLIRIVYTLHQKYMIIHRNITPENIEIDQFGNLKLVQFTSCVKCYQNNNGSIQKLRYPKKLFQSKNMNKDQNINKNYQEKLYQYQKGSNNVTISNEKQKEKKKSQNQRLLKQLEIANEQQWYDIGIYTPIQVKKKSKNGYDKMVDYYSVGMIIKQLFEKEEHLLKESRQHFQNDLNTINNNNTKATTMLMNKIISGLISQNIQDRQEIVNELIQGMGLKNTFNLNKNKDFKNKFANNQNEKSNLQQGIQQDYLSTQIQILTLNELWLGKFIPFVSTKCVQNDISDGQFNGINHEEIIQYFKPIQNQKEKKLKNQCQKNKTKTTKKNISRSRNKSHQGKNTISITNSRQKSNNKKKLAQKNSQSITSHSHKTTTNSTANHPQTNINSTKSRTKSTNKSKQKQKQSSKSISKQKQQNIKAKGNILKNNQEPKATCKSVQNKSNSNSRQRQQKDIKKYDVNANGSNIGNHGLKGNNNKSKSKEKHQKLPSHQYQTGIIKNPMTNNAYANIGNLNIPHPRK